ncbi:MAG: TfuA-like protein [Polyangiaceae bacterium]|jgi:hypothetical protein
MRLHVFTGPTIDAQTVRDALDAEVSGPAAFGDVYRAAQTRPTAIAIVDGYFERIPAVWHKEILWAMAEGIHVFGASSMGALRAAELAEFGMEGVGAIYEAFRRGELEDDDEVAVAHGPADRGFRVLSEAMVNIRATIGAARAAGVVTSDTAAGLVRIAKRRFYADRAYASIIADAQSEGVAQTDIQRLTEWLPQGRVDQKRLDALALLHRLAQWLATKPERKRVSYRFERTDAWEEASRALSGIATTTSQYVAREEASLEEELKIAGIYAQAVSEATARGAAIDAAARAGVQPDGSAMRLAIGVLRRDLGLQQREAFDRWLDEQRLYEGELGRFLEEQARLQWARPWTEATARAHLVNHLRAKNQYGHFAARAEAKAQELREIGSSCPSLADVGMSEPELWTWYFSEIARTPVVADIEAFARAAGFTGRDEFRVAVLREVQWQRHGRSSNR